MEKVIVKRSFLKRNKDHFKTYALLSFPIAWWGLFFVTPFVMALVISFSDMKSAFTINNFGISQYKYVLTDRQFYDSLRVTFIWTALMTVGNNLFGFLTAYAIYKLKRGRRFFLALLFWPFLVSAVANANITKFVFGPSSNNLVNAVLRLFGQSPVAWLDKQRTALFSLVILPFFLGFSVKMIIFYTGLLAIPSQYYEAARLETNKAFPILRYITLPLLKNIIVLNLLLSVIDGIKVVGPMMLVTKGNFGTMSAVYYIYTNIASNKARAAASAFIVFIVILIVSAVQLKLSGKSGATYE